jgi:uncharacterized protein YbaP (TraB family)
VTAELLAAVLDRFDRATAAGADPLAPLRAAWLAGDGERLLAEAFTGLSPAARDHIARHLLAERNVRFTERVAGRLAEQPAAALFVAIGAGHLLGAGSVVDLLTARGHAVERVAWPGPDGPELTGPS